MLCSIENMKKINTYQFIFQNTYFEMHFSLNFAGMEESVKEKTQNLPAVIIPLAKRKLLKLQQQQIQLPQQLFPQLLKCPLPVQ